MSKLQAALRWAARGFRVFPLQENSRDPRELAWTEHATTDPDRIRSMWTNPVLGYEYDYNIGCLATEWIITDIDVKDGKPGLANHAALGFDWDTLTVATTTGGYHEYRQPIDRVVGSGHLLHKDDGIDVKSYHGYVVAPGSTIDGKEYVVVLDLPVAPFPEHLRHMLKSPRARRESSLVANVEVDTPEAVEIAAHWLTREAPVAVEGQNGDDTTYRVACRLRDFGLSEDAAADLMLDEYNPRCEPPWSSEDLRAKVENAYRYASGAQGAANPVAVFGSMDFVPPPAPEPLQVVNGAQHDGAWQFGNLIRREDLTDRTYIFGDVLIAGVVSQLVGAGKAGKSVLALVLSCHLVVGRDFMGWRCVRPMKVLFYDAEDDVKEQSRRVHAVCKAYDLPEDDVRAGLSLNSDEEEYGLHEFIDTAESEVAQGLRVATGRPIRSHAAHITRLVQAASDPDIGLIVIGPLIDIHEAKENDNTEMNYVLGVLRALARRTSTAVLVVHHTGKPPVASANAWAGDQNAGRGSSSIAAKSRATLTLFSASEDDCAEAGISPAERANYVQLDTAAATYAPPGLSKKRWLRWHSVDVAVQSGLSMRNVSVGVLVPHDARAAAAGSAEDLARVLRDRMLRMGRASLTVPESVAAVQDADPAAAKQDARAVRSRIERSLAAPVAVDGATLRIERAAEGGRTVLTIVMG